MSTDPMRPDTNLHAAVVYIVDIEVDAAHAGAYLDWLRAHAAEILDLPGFTGATLHERHDPPPASGRVAYCAHYTLRDQAALDDYLRDHAPRLRAEGQARFGDRFSASRRVLRVLSGV